jgi:hypothetical protein
VALRVKNVENPAQSDPIHDAFLIEAPSHRIERDAALMQEIMRRASRVVLSTPEREFALRSKATFVRYPQRYSDPQGEFICSIVIRQLAAMEETRAAG